MNRTIIKNRAIVRKKKIAEQTPNIKNLNIEDVKKIRSLVIKFRVNYKKYFRHNPQFQNDILAVIKKTVNTLKSTIRSMRKEATGVISFFCSEDLFEFSSMNSVLTQPQLNSFGNMLCLMDENYSLSKVDVTSALNKVSNFDKNKNFGMVCLIKSCPQFKENLYIGNETVLISLNDAWDV